MNTTSSAALRPPAGPQPHGGSPSVAELIALISGFLVLYGETYVTLDKTVWSIIGQGHGPIMVALSLWLAWIRRDTLTALPATSAPIGAGAVLLIGATFYIVGKSQGVLAFEVFSQIFVLMTFLLLFRGWAGVRLMWFPLAFLLLVVPLPGAVVAAITGPLKSYVSVVAEWLLYQAGYPIGRTGVTLVIGQYKLLVADACAGLNSIFALEAIGVFYMSIMGHTNKWRNISLALLILPISFISNVIRVIVLALVTFYFGDAAGQGFIHDFAGILLFVVATILTIGTDTVLGLFFKEPKSPPNNKTATVDA